MLTGLDFPATVFYGEQAQWVRDDRAGAVRMGLNFWVLDRTDEVVFVRLPRPGTIVVKGETIGHVDFANGTFPIQAPVSGVVFLPNPDLRLDADLLRQDAFGVGYLLDIEDVPDADVEMLLDADEAMAFYSTFEVEGKINARTVIEPDRPWFTTMDLRVGETTLARARILPPLANEAFVPDWDIGTKWAIQTVTGGITRTYDFEVTGETTVGGEAVFRVEALERSEPTLSEGGVSLEPAPISRLLYYRITSFTLLCWDEVPSDRPTMFKRHWNPRGEGLYVRLEPEDGFFYDHAFIPPGRHDFTRDLPKIPAQPALVDHYRFRGGGSRCEAEARATLRNELGYEERFFSQQIWIAGQPWWREAVRMRGDKVLLKAKLLTEEDEQK